MKHPSSAGAIALGLALAACTAAPADEASQVDERLAVRIETDEADAALAILAGLAADTEPDADAWSHLLSTEGYRRLRRRETTMGRPFEEADFREFLLADSMRARVELLSSTLEDWKRVDLSGAARLALAYLPDGARIRATLYPVIKPRSNSFVFETGTDSAAIFLFLDPQVDGPKLRNTMAHELHHIGFAGACIDVPPREVPEPVHTASRWMGAFGEGVAMLAAAGGPDVHPHQVSGAEERARWDRDVANVPADLRRLESFFLDVIDERISEPDSVQAAAMEFFGEQGPWYTVGWLMASTIERELGRDRLIGSLCEPTRLLREYNEAAAARNAATGSSLPLWSESLLSRLPA